ncbi:hypothetical protein BCR35DRAFT_301707 [Leucosporidium creatinivorum]|uniref:t-SNARE coiled-coil homology domain-containing protein n=1 Tax=Leucosporidium creatinivorum TaxID=106004 RepID=A0A1Y2FW41_9BASI|nr:hypothetical protein BCR35DRAFT_301707 [Leucosporidium creatinivorum]
MSWARGNSKTAASDAQESELEAQNDSHLNELHSKLQALRGVTTDIYRDSQGQNSLLDNTSNSFDQFKTSLSNTSTRFARSVQSGKGNARTQLGIVGGVVLLFFLYKLFGGGSSVPSPPQGVEGSGRL